MPTRHFEYRKLLATLASYDVDYILVGGVCAVAHGAPVTTFDVDVLYRMGTDNLDRIMAALAEIEAVHREPGTRRLPPDAGALERGAPCLFSTSYGSLDMLGILASRERFEELLPHTVQLELHGGLRVRAQDLETLIAVKRGTGRPKDILVVPVLEATLRELTRHRDSED